MLEIMGNSPYDFVLNHSESDLNAIKDKSIHRTLTEKILAILFLDLKKFILKTEVLKICFWCMKMKIIFSIPLKGLDRNF